MPMRYRVAALLSICAVPLFAALKAPPKEVKGKLVNDLPPPYNVQAVVKNHSVALAWQWQPPEQQPLFSDFGYDVLRQDGTNAVVSQTSYADLNIPEGNYSYKVRVRGDAKDHGGQVAHVSSWSETVTASVALSCAAVPRIDLTVTPTQRTFNSIPSLRMHLTGRITSPPGCTSTNATYHVDAETGSSHTGPLTVSPDGRFDQFADALGPDDEAPAGETTFTVTVSVDNEAGPATSNAYSVSVHLQNKFAPQ